ncbi:MAG: DUF393 domain-containing protein [Pseudomonadota bacterium]
MKNKTNRLTVFFDGSCPLCRREIGFYQRRPGADMIDWVDLTDADQHHVDTQLGPDLTCTAALERFHVRTSTGSLKDGAAGFVELWKALPQFRWLGRLVSIPPILWIAERAYNAFLKIRPRMQAMARAQA